MNPREEGSPSKYPSRQRKMKLALLLVGLVFGAAVFLTLDWFHTAAIQHTLESTGKPNACRVHDPVRHHALAPNCTSIERWGGDSFEFFTNSLGFRDEKIREVPLADARPRILMLGDSFTKGELAWRDSYVGRVAAHFSQYDFLNGGVASYSPSNYLNVARMVLAKGVDIDEVIVFIDISDVQDEAAFYRDLDASGAVAGVEPEQEHWIAQWYAQWRFYIVRHLLLTNYVFEFFERFLVGHGHYYLTVEQMGNAFDNDRSAWTYRKVNETDPYRAGYAPLGVEGGIAKEKTKMTFLWQELEKRNIPISVVVYPWPAQVVHDTTDSRQVRIWRDWCEGKCKRFISVFPAFFAAKNQCPRSQPGCWYLNLFVFRDVHYNAAGNALVADAVIRTSCGRAADQAPVARLRPRFGQGSKGACTLAVTRHLQQPTGHEKIRSA
jgi:hypothetical protein